MLRPQPKGQRHSKIDQAFVNVSLFMLTLRSGVCLILLLLFYYIIITFGSLFTMTSSVYAVKENGLEFQPAPSSQSSCDFLESFQQTFEMNILDQPNENELVFELKHVDMSDGCYRNYILFCKLKYHSR
jgi:hypothetical protein